MILLTGGTFGLLIALAAIFLVLSNLTPQGLTFPGILNPTGAKPGVSQPTPSPYTWSNSGPEGGNITALAIDPITPATLYAAAQGGLFKTVDGGKNWKTILGGFTGGWLYTVVIDPTRPATLYAAGGSGVLKAQTAPPPGSR